MRYAILIQANELPPNYDALAKNLSEHGHRDVECFLVADRRARKDLPEQASTARQTGLACQVLSLEDQRQLAGDELWRALPFDSPVRIGLGLLAAYQRNVDIVLLLDPESTYPDNCDFLSLHRQAFQEQAELCNSPSGWLNLARCVQFASTASVANRGFPFEPEVGMGEPEFTSGRTSAIAHLGLQRGVFDADAARLLEGIPKVQGMRESTPSRFVLGPGTWAGLGRRNLSLRREAIPAYCLSAGAGNYADVWAGFVLLRIAQHLGQSISVGEPLAHCASSPSNLKKLYEFELAGYRLTLPLCSALRSLPLAGTSFHDCFGEVAEKLEKAWPETPRASAVEIEARKQFLVSLRLWHLAFSRLLAGDAARLQQSLKAEQPVSAAHAVGPNT